MLFTQRKSNEAQPSGAIALNADLPSWIQAISAACLVILTLLTLVVLRGYAADTKTIANVSASQTENSQMLAIVMRRRPDHSEAGWGIENQGFGPAINVTYGIPPNRSWSVEALSKGAVYAAHSDIADAFNQKQLVLIDYESLTGKKYRTTVTMVGNVMKTEFQKMTH